MGTKNEIW